MKMKEHDMREEGNTVGVVFDREDLLDMVDGDADILEELVGMFLTAVPDGMEIIRTALAQSDYLGAARQAHKLKGTAANLRAPILHSAFTDLEEALKQKDVARTIQWLNACSDEFDHFRKVFKHGV
jgi:HPt (histidine-containing phosphotransfer) domain-containing protein